MMKIEKNTVIGDLVAEDYRAAAVFGKYGIDFCCQGNRSIAEACEKKDLDAGTVLSDLEAVMATKSESAIDFKSWPLDLLADYIEKKHHRYVESKIQEIKPYLEKICKVHVNKHPELFEIKEHFDAAAGELTTHMKKEELILFPFVRKMVKALDDKQGLDAPHFGTVENPIQMMQHEHSIEGERFSAISNLSANYTPPQDACNTYKVAFAMLKEFEKDLHLHIHLENNILFPAAIQMEKRLQP